MRTRTTVLAVLAVLAAAGCTTSSNEPSSTASSPATSPTAPATSEPTGTHAPAQDPNVTVDQVVAVYWAADCRTDTRTGDARKRSLPWLTGPAAENAAAEVREAHNAAWLELCSHQGWFTVTSTDAAAAFEFPRDTATRAHRARIVTLTPTGSDGWSGTEVIYVAQFELVNDGRGWLVLDMDYARSAGLPTGEGWE